MGRKEQRELEIHTLDLAELRTNVSTTVNDAWTDPGSVGELAGFFVDLRDKLTGRSKDQ